MLLRQVCLSQGRKSSGRAAGLRPIRENLPSCLGLCRRYGSVTVHTSHQADWKVTTGYRVLVKVGWGATVLAIYLAAAAVILESVTVWWMVAALAAGAIVVGLMLPEPVPHDMLNRNRTQVDPLQRR